MDVRINIGLDSRYNVIYLWGGNRYSGLVNEVMNTSWLNNMNTLLCLKCKHEWIQPAKAGRCPKCHSDKTELVLQRVNELPRI